MVNAFADQVSLTTIITILPSVLKKCCVGKDVCIFDMLEKTGYGVNVQIKQ